MGSSKTSECPICHKTFSRSDHLKRHQLRHSGLRPYCCMFCNEQYTRSDNLKDHYPNCLLREGRPVPEAARQGRRSHACDSCTSMKVGCDGKKPCKRCQSKDITCLYERLQANEEVLRDDAIKPRSENNNLSDRGSIKFLLNSGTASFIESFRFPSSWERKNISELKTSASEAFDATSPTFVRNGSEAGSTYSDPFEPENIDWSIFDDENFLRFFTSPFEGQVLLDGMFASVPLDPSFALTETTSGLSTAPLIPWEPPSPQSAAIVQALIDTASSLNINEQENTEISGHLNFLFTPSKIENLCNLYFEFWHPHCPLVHQPSFRIDTSPIQLLLSMTLMGAMYSSIDREVSTAKLLLDIAEIYVFSMDDMREDFEIWQIVRMSSSMQYEQPIAPSCAAIQNIQSGHLIVCAQFWAGNTMAKKRVVETRFGVVIKLVRRLGLTHAQHDSEDSINEYSWVLKETRIRTMTVIGLLDCGFTFFANFPARLTAPEMKFDLPCEEVFFSSPNPFSEPSFLPSRQVTAFSAFQSLFVQHKSQSPQNGNHSKGSKTNSMNLNSMDMFLLIHLLYVYAHNHILMFSSQSHASRDEDIQSSKNTENTPNSGFALIKTALSRWRSLWVSIRAKISNRAWANLGFFKHGYGYWLVTSLLVTHPGSADILTRMPVNCEDTLRQLRGLIRETGGEL